MPIFKTITSESDLPTIGESHEDLNLDMKSYSEQIETAKHYPEIEMAKDVAAFSNSTGGVILVGAFEKNNHGGYLSHYTPISHKKAEEVKKSFNVAVENRCSPSPLIDIAIIQKDGGYIVAVNIWAFPGQPIGVRGQIDKQLEGKGFLAYFFPLRVGTNTVFIKPEQLPMLMLPDVRRTAILLDAIPTEARKKLTIHGVKYLQNFNGLVPETFPGELVSFDYLKNSITINVKTIMQGTPNEKGFESMVLPLDVVKSVWKCDEEWIIALGGHFTENRRRWYHE